MKKHQPRKRFGQNFLCDQRIIQQIVHAINPQPSDNLLEIGPGLGALTTQLLPRAKTMQAIELDRDLIPKLTVICHGLGQLNIHQGDVLSIAMDQFGSEQQPLRIVGNLPYNISTPLIFHLLQFTPIIHDMHFMLQHEVVKRLTAEPGSAAYGRLSIMVQVHCQAEALFNVPPAAFSPAPKVQSSVVRLVPHQPSPYDIHDPALFAELVREAFNQRRKTLRNSLSPYVTAETLEQLNIDANCRPQDLTISDYAKLSNYLSPIKK